ncbi:hypothetical protein FRC19_000480 [Serendipita sp. 401]|nr:hypothetical protein FRC19_000480 [Serendipita sp. 401]
MHSSERALMIPIRRSLPHHFPHSKTTSYPHHRHYQLTYCEIVVGGDESKRLTGICHTPRDTPHPPFYDLCRFYFVLGMPVSFFSSLFLFLSISLARSDYRSAF